MRKRGEGIRRKERVKEREKKGKQRKGKGEKT